MRQRTPGFVTAASLALVLGASACGGAASEKTADSGEIRIAVVSPHAGPYAEFGAQQRAGFEYAAQEANAQGGIDGRKVVIFEADSLGTPAGAVSAAQRLVQRNQARFIVGTIATTETLAVMQRLKSWNALQLGTQSQGDDLTGASCVAGFYRTNMSDSIAIAGLGVWLKDRHQKQWDSIAADYAFGRDSTEGLKRILDAEGGTLDKELYAPLGTTDFGSYASQLKGGGGLLIAESGNDSVNFLKQALQFDVLSKYKLVVGNTALTTSSLGAVNDPRLVGAWSTANWVPTADNPESKAFVEAFTKATGKPPADYTGAAYIAMQTLFAGIRKAGDTEPAKVGEALNGLTYTTIQGEVTMRAADHQIEAPMYLGQVEQTDQGLALVAKQTIPASQTNPQPNPACKLGS